MLCFWGRHCLHSGEFIYAGGNTAMDYFHPERSINTPGHVMLQKVIIPKARRCSPQRREKMSP